MFDKYNLPLTVELTDGTILKIRNKCDYRMVLDCIGALNDNDLTDEEKAKSALIIFYENYQDITDPQEAIDDLSKIISYDDETQQESNKPILMDWQKDFKQLAPPVSRILGYDIRIPDKYTHWWTFVGGYMEIGECTFSTVVSIRSKKVKGVKLDKWEEEFCREHPEMINLPTKYTKEEEEFFSLFEQKGEV